MIRLLPVLSVFALAACNPSKQVDSRPDVKFTELNGPMSEEEIRSLEVIGISLNDDVEKVRGIAEEAGFTIHEKNHGNLDQLIVSIRGTATDTDFCAEKGVKFSLRVIIPNRKDIEEISCSSERAPLPNDVASYEIADRNARSGNGLKLYVMAPNEERRSVLEVTCGTVVTGSFSGGNPCIRINEGSDSYAYVERYMKESRVPRIFNNKIRIKR